jgi:esterase/lipase superfamily enzyme
MKSIGRASFLVVGLFLIMFVLSCSHRTYVTATAPPPPSPSPTPAPIPTTSRAPNPHPILDPIFAGGATAAAGVDADGGASAAAGIDADNVASPSRKPSSAAEVKVFYATDRQAAAAPVTFGGKRGDGSLHYGICTVSIPSDHRLADIERPSIWRLEFKENPAKHFVIVSRANQDEAAFYQEVAQTVRDSGDKQAFVFIHGFNVTFDDAVYRTAQMAYDLGFSGAPILYSWPSNGKVQDYTWDMTANDWAVPHLRGFLESVAARTGAHTIHLIAHSMGNRLLVNALNSMEKPASPRFRQIVLTAPDIDAATFVELAGAVKSQASQVTLYASAHDKALLASKKLNGGPRAGDAGKNIVVVQGIDTIDVSALKTDFLGHSYYGDNGSVLTDIFKLLSTGDPPDRRSGLHKTGTAPNLYWVFSP